MNAIGHCCLCGEFTRIDHRTGLCEWCETEADTAGPDWLWERDCNPFFGDVVLPREARDAF